jgi:hypothetical protein
MNTITKASIEAKQVEVAGKFLANHHYRGENSRIIDRHIDGYLFRSPGGLRRSKLWPLVGHVMGVCRIK